MVALAALALAAFGGSAVAAEVGAKQSVKLPLNGDFSGAASDDALAPGWTLMPDMGGSAKVVPTEEPGKFALEVRATEEKLQMVHSDFIPVDGTKGGWVKLKAQSSGYGKGQFGLSMYDASRADKHNGCTTRGDADRDRTHCEIGSPVSPEARFVRVNLAALPGSTIRFRDVAARIEPADPEPKSTSDFDTNKPAPAMRTVRDGESFPYDVLKADEHFAVRATVGKAFKFSLGGPREGHWDHFTVGIEPLKEFETGDAADAGKLFVTITPSVEGTSAFVIGCRDKTVTVHCTATK